MAMDSATGPARATGSKARIVTASRILLALGGGVAALAVALSSAVIANQVKNPGTAVALGIGPSALARGNLAFATYAARQKTDRTTAITAEERELALQAFRREPLSSAALGMIIASMPEQDAQRRSALLDVGARMTRRSSMITSASIEAAARTHNEPAFFQWLSRAILTSPGLRTAYVTAMAQATARPGAEQTLAPVIGQGPSWADTYWNAVVAVPDSLENAAKLRILVAGAPWRQQAVMDSDRVLAIRLVGNGHFDAARNLALALGGKEAAPARGGGDLLMNGNFNHAPTLPPIDWQLSSLGNLGASIDATQKSLVISAIGGARGYAARQLIHLEPGRYRLSWNLAANGALPQNALIARLQCLEDVSSPDNRSIPLTTGQNAADLSLASATCRWFWMGIGVDVPDGGAGFDAQFKRIILTSMASDGSD
ncbi:hypothetical protein [Sphingopyxis terrae]